MRSIRLATLLALALLLGAGGNACADDCGAANCTGENLVVSWRQTAVPAAASYRLCLNDHCEQVEPREWSDDRLMVGLADSSPDDVVARLELSNEAGLVEQTFTGEGNISGTCCRAAVFRVVSEGRLVEDD